MFLQALLQWKIIITYSQCVSLAVIIQYAMCMRHSILSSVVSPAVQYFSTLSHKTHNFGGKIFGTWNVLIFSTIFTWNIYHSNKNSTRYYHKCILVFMYSALYSCQIWIKVEFSRHISEKCSHIKFHENPSSKSQIVSYGRTDGQTDRCDEVNSRFLPFCERAEQEREIWNSLSLSAVSLDLNIGPYRHRPTNHLCYCRLLSNSTHTHTHTYLNFQFTHPASSRSKA
jgi:hypothetical protein